MSIAEFNKVFRSEYGPSLQTDLKRDYCKVQLAWTTMADSFVKLGYLTESSFLL